MHVANSLVIATNTLRVGLYDDSSRSMSDSAATVVTLHVSVHPLDTTF